MKKVLVLCWLQVVLVLWCGGSGHAELYGYQDREGRWHFPDLRTGGAVEERGKHTNVSVSLATYMPIISDVSKRYSISPALVKAIIMAESAYDRAAISRKGAKGLMQLMPETARQLNVGNPFSVRGNIEGGVKYLKYLLDKFHNDPALAAAAYNAGPARVEAAGDIPPIPETRQFVQRVLYFYNQFKYEETN